MPSRLTAPFSDTQRFVRAVAEVGVGADAPSYSLTVPPPPSGSWALDSQLPAGLTLRTYNDHSTSWGTGWSVAAWGGGGRITRITDATAPSPITLTGQPDDTNSGSSVINQNWAGVTDGQSPDILTYTMSGPPTRVFVGCVLYIAAPMLDPARMTNEVKLLEFIGGGGSTWIGLYPPGDDKNPGSAQFQYVLVSRVGGDTVSAQVVETPIPTDTWHKVQFELVRSPASGRAWVNDVLVQQTGGSFTYGAVNPFEQFYQGTVWGGGNAGSAPTGAFVRYAATAIWSN